MLVAECGNIFCCLITLKSEENIFFRKLGILFVFLLILFSLFDFLFFVNDDFSCFTCVLVNFVISRLCKLFFFSFLLRERISRKAGKKVFIFSHCYYKIVFFFLRFFFSFFFAFRSCMSHFSQESYFWNWTLDEKLVQTTIFLSLDSGKVSPWKSYGLNFTWLATGSRIDSIVLVWKTGMIYMGREDYKVLSKKSLPNFLIFAYFCQTMKHNLTSSH